MTVDPCPAQVHPPRRRRWTMTLAYVRTSARPADTAAESQTDERLCERQVPPNSLPPSSPRCNRQVKSVFALYKCPCGTVSMHIPFAVLCVVEHVSSLSADLSIKIHSSPTRVRFQLPAVNCHGSVILLMPHHNAHIIHLLTQALCQSPHKKGTIRYSDRLHSQLSRQRVVMFC